MNTLSAEKYKEYFRMILDLELELYQLRRLEENIEDQIERTEEIIKRSAPKPEPKADTIVDVVIFLFLGAISGAILGAILGIAIWLIRMIFFLIKKDGLLFLITWLFYSFSELDRAGGGILSLIILFAVIGAAIGLFFTLCMQVFDSRNQKILYREYEQKEAERQRMLAVQKKNLSGAYPILQRCGDAIEQTEETLDQYYSLDIIHEKYRGLIPVATIYEYFDTGLCTKLTGHKGAYLIYEQQLRANIIIGKLDRIIDRLDDIAENQMVLAQSIETSNRMIDGLSNSLSQSMQKMVENQEINNYYNSINAKNTQFLAEYTLYKELFK